MVIIVLLTLNIFGGGKNRRAGDIQSILILPLENLTGDDNQDHMVSSMHTLLITDMGRIGDLRILGKVTASKYCGSHMTASEIAAESNCPGTGSDESTDQGPGTPPPWRESVTMKRD